MDTFDPIMRSRIMSRVKSAGTGLEKKFLQILKDAKIRGFTEHAPGIVGSPDVVFRKEKIAIFVDSCFWHGCEKHLRRPGSNRKFWRNKIDGNVSRDKRKRAYLRRHGWSVLRVWEHDMKQPEAVARKIKRTIEKRRAQKNQTTERHP